MSACRRLCVACTAHISDWIMDCLLDGVTVERDIRMVYKFAQ
jgi:hypothetical protein